MSSNPTVSVIVLTLNNQNFIASALESIRKQSFTDFEVLIIDGNSTDQTRSHLDRFAEQDSRFKWFTQQSRGIGGAAQEGLLKARGQWIMKLDADDIAHPERLKRQMDFLNAHPDHIFVGSWLEFIDPSGNSLGIRKYPVAHEEILQAFQVYNPLPNPASVFSKSAALKAGGYNPETRCTEDLELFLKMIPYGKFHNLPEPLTFYRQHADSHKSTRANETVRQTVRLRLDAYKKGYLRPTLRGILATLAQTFLSFVPSQLIVWGFYKFAAKTQAPKTLNPS